jgi:hypothetical protein
MVRPMRASYIGISQQWRALSTDGNSVTPAQVTSIKLKDKSLNLIAWPSGDEFGLRLPQAQCLLGFPEREMSAVGT